MFILFFGFTEEKSLSVHRQWFNFVLLITNLFLRSIFEIQGKFVCKLQFNIVLYKVLNFEFFCKVF